MSEIESTPKGEIPGQVQQKPLVIIDVPPYDRFLIRCQSNERVYDIFFLDGKLQEVIHTERIKV